MDCSIELRYAIPPLIYLILLLFRNSESLPWNQGASLEAGHHTTLMIPILLLAIAILFVLFTSIKLPLSVSTKPIRLRARDFSVAVAISLLASLVLPPPLFWFAHALIICTSPWFGLFLNLFKHVLCWLCHTLRAIPTLIIICTTPEHETVEDILDRVEIDAFDVEGQPAIQDQSSLENDFGVIID